MGLIGKYKEINQKTTQAYKLFLGLIVIVVCSVVFMSCSKKRPCGEICRQTQGEASIESQRSTSRLQEAFNRHVQRKLRTKKPDDQITENIISLSTGGQYGAYGAGFTIGWHASETMPRFDVVTAVSTGALLSPFMFLLSGETEFRKDLINHLEVIYGEGLRDEMVVKGSPIGNLISKKAIYDRSPLRELLNDVIKDQYLDEIGKQYDDRFLLVGIASMDTGEFKIVDLTWVASEYKDDKEKRRRIFVDTLMASSAVPIVYPPVFIDGEMFIDGGAREHVIFETLDSMIQVALSREETVNLMDSTTEINKTFYVLINGDITVKDQCAPFGLKNIGSRAATIALDQLLLSSVFFNAYLAKSFDVEKDSRGNEYLVSNKEDRWNIRVKDARGHECKFDDSNNSMFNPGFTRCLYKKGYADSTSLTEEDWIEDLEPIKNIILQNRVSFDPKGKEYKKCEPK